MPPRLPQGMRYAPRDPAPELPASGPPLAFIQSAAPKPGVAPAAEPAWVARLEMKLDRLLGVLGLTTEEER